MTVNYSDAAPVLSRREFVARVGALGAALPLIQSPILKGNPTSRQAKERPICIFSKHLQFLDYDAMAETAAEAGFDGVDLSVRNGGHIVPERVVDDLPRAVEAVQKVGLHVPMMTSGIRFADEPHTETVLKAASAQGIDFYRMGYLAYEEKRGVEENLGVYRSKMAELADLNKNYGIRGAYQNHAGTRVGGPVWDLYLLLNGLDPQWIGVQYDIHHAVVEGGNSWPLGLRLLSPYVHSMAIKDFIWTEREGRWRVQTVPLEEGMVDFDQYMKIIKEEQISGPISLHFEYPLPGEDDRNMSLLERSKRTATVMRRDLEALRSLLTDAGLY